MQRYENICISPNFFVPLRPDINIQIKILMRKITLFLLSLFALSLSAQVTTVPAIVQKGYGGEITVIYNPNEGNKGMADATQCYAHTGVTIDDKDWQKAGTWRDGKEKYKMTKNADGNWELKITPNIYSYYGISPDHNVTKLCFVFNDGPGGKKEGKTSEGGDIFVELAEKGLAVLITNSLPDISNVGDKVTLNCVATEDAQLSLSVNGKEVKTAEGTSLTYSYTYAKEGDYEFTFTATKGDKVKTTSAFTCVVTEPIKQNRPEGIVNGIYYDKDDNTKVTLCTYAATKLAADESGAAKTITVKAKLPSHWTKTITAWVWESGAEGKSVTPTRDGDWYVVSQKCATLNIIFRNGTDWDGDSNQTEDITATSNMNIQVAQSGSGKAKYDVLERDLVVKAKMPSNWTEKITAVVTPAGGSEKVVTPTLQNGWYVFSETCKSLSVVYRNGDATTDANQSAPISLDNNTMLQLTQEGQNKAVCNIVTADPAKHVFVVGDFNNWTISNDYQLKQANDSAYFWIELEGLAPQKEYAMQYVVVRADGQTKRISDLYSEKLLHPDDKYEPKTVDPTLMDYPKQGEGYVTVIQTDKPQYKWSDATLNFKRPDKNNLVIYELWVYDYTPQRSLNAVKERLGYLKGLGVNAIELMPVCEFEGNYNWGYSPTHYFAFDKAYGSSDDMKAFVDACHQLGIAVIVDMVFNHATGLNPMNKLNDLKLNPWFNENPPHGDNVYEDWNHDFAPTKTMFTRALQYWLTEYKVDGFRMDLSHGLCGTTNNAMTHIADYYNYGVKAVAEDAYFILEHWGSNMGGDRPSLVNQGMMCWENTNEAYRTTAAGSTSGSFSNANKLGYVSYCESHDEERMVYQARTKGMGDLKTNEKARLKRATENVIFNVLLAGPHMIWQFEEIGYDFSINSSEGSPQGTSSDNRCAKKQRPEYLGYFQHPDRVEQYTKIAQAIQLRTQLLSDKFVAAKKPSKATLSGKLRTIQWGNDVYVAGNFHLSENQKVTIPAGTWYNYYTQTQQTATEVELAPGEFIILTGTAVKLPEIDTNFTYFTDVENVLVPELPAEILPPYNATIYTISGQVVSVQRNVEQVNMDALNNGLYLIQIEKNGQRVTKKVIR